MAIKRQNEPESESERVEPEPAAVEYLTDLVHRLPDSLDDWGRVNENGNRVPVPVVWEFIKVRGIGMGTAYEVAQRVWPDRAKYLEWLLDPYASPFGPGGPAKGYLSHAPYLWPSRQTAAEERAAQLANERQRREGEATWSGER